MRAEPPKGVERDRIQGNERRGKRFRDRNRRGAAAASERTGVVARASKVAFANANAGEDERGDGSGSMPDGVGLGVAGDGVGNGRGGVAHGVKLLAVEQRQAEQLFEAVGRQIEHDRPADIAVGFDRGEGNFLSRHECILGVNAGRITGDFPRARARRFVTRRAA